MGVPGSSAGKESTSNAGDPSSIPGLGRSPGEGIGYSLQYSGLENPHGQRSLAGYSPWGCKELDTTELQSPAQHPGRVEAQYVHILPFRADLLCRKAFFIPFILRHTLSFALVPQVSFISSFPFLLIVLQTLATWCTSRVSNDSSLKRYSLGNMYLYPDLDPTSQFLLALSIQTSCWGLSWWCSGWESLQFNPWSGMIPQTAEQLSACSATLEPVSRSPQAATAEPTSCNSWSLCAQSPWSATRGATAVRSLSITAREQPPLSATRESLCQQPRSRATKTQIN